MDEKEVKKVVRILKEARGPAPIGYIARRTGLDEPLKLLERLEEEGLIKRAEFSGWSASLYPMYEVAPGVVEEY